MLGWKHHAVVAVSSLVFGSPTLAYLSASAGHSSSAPLGIIQDFGDPTLDPKPGTALPVLINPSGKTISAKVVIVFLSGDCASCAKNSISTTKLLPERDKAYVAVFQATRKQITANITPAPGVQFVTDESGNLHTSLNARWKPRWYRFVNGKLTKIQTDVGDRSYEESN